MKNGTGTRFPAGFAWPRAAALSVFCLATSANAQDDNHCLELIKHSRTIAVEVQDEAELSGSVKNFCREYSQSRNENRSADYGFDYDLLSLSMDENRRTEDAVAYRYCRDERDAGSAQAHYRSYLEGIAPGAYDAHRACLKSDEVSFRMLSPSTPDNLELVVQFSSDDSNSTTDLSWNSPSVGVVECRWENAEDAASRTITLSSNTRTRLMCARNDPRSNPRTQPDHVSVIRVDGGPGNISIPWQKYNESNEPINTIATIGRQLDRKLKVLEERIDGLQKRNGYLEESLANSESRLTGLLNRSWHDVTGYRHEDACYRNGSQYPIEVAVTTAWRGGNFCRVLLFVGNLVVAESADNNPNFAKACSIVATIPPGATYKVDADGYRNGDISFWRELRDDGGKSERVDCP